MARDFAFFLLLFFVLLPTINALMDWLSWAVTRFNVSFLEIASPSVMGAAFMAGVLIVDIVASIVFVIVLTVILPIGLELVDLLLLVLAVIVSTGAARLVRRCNRPGARACS